MLVDTRNHDMDSLRWFSDFDKPSPGAIRVLYAEATGNERAWSYSVVTYDNASTTDNKWRRKSIIYVGDHHSSNTR